MINFIKNKNSIWKKVAGILLFYILFSVTITIFAAPPTTKYLPGDTLDPSCAPGDSNCTVAIEPAVVNFTNIDVSDSPYSVLTTDQVIYADTSGGDVEITLPSIATFSEKRTIIILKTAEQNNLNVYSASGDYINDTTAIYVTDNKRAIRIESIKANQWLSVSNFENRSDSVNLTKGATIANLSASYSNGASGVGATLTASPAATLPVINGVTYSVGERILVKNQTDPIENGVYQVTATSSPWVLTRDSDSDETSELNSQIIIPANGTSVNRGHQFSQQTPDPVIGTSNIVYINVTGIVGSYVTQNSSGSHVSGQIPFWTSSVRQLSKGSSALFWDDTNKRLGINTASPNSFLQISPVVNDSSQLLTITGTTSPSNTVGGGVSITTGNGGDDAISSFGADGGSFVVTSGNGGSGSFGPPTSGGDGGIISLKGGSGGFGPSTGGTGGEIFIIGGSGGLGGRDGNVYLGVDESSSVRGNVIVGMSSGFSTSTKLQVYSSVHDGSDFYSASFLSDGNDTNRYGILVQAGLDNQASAGPSTLVQFNDGDGTAVGSITFGSNATSYNTSSDQRLKENIVDTSLALEDLMKIKIRDFNWISDSDQKLAHGVIAQELFDVYPGAVTVPNEDDKYWMVDYSKLTPLIVKAIQDLELKVESISINENPSGISISTVISYLEESANKTINGVVSFFEIITDKITTQKLCVEDVCVTKNEFLDLLQQNNIEPVLEDDLVNDDSQENIGSGDNSVEETLPEEVTNSDEQNNNEENNLNEDQENQIPTISENP